MGVMMLALLGFPLFGGAGFLAKWYILQAALHAPIPQTHLAVVLVLTTVLSAGYYMRVVMVIFMRQPTESAPEPPAAGRMTRGVLLATTILLLWLGIAPESLVRLTRSSRVETIFGGPVPVAVAAPRPH
jgi:NADH-quinone oxidoreductase subunit N